MPEKVWKKAGYLSEIKTKKRKEKNILLIVLSL